jgi:hypothetical protein
MKKIIGIQKTHYWMNERKKSLILFVIFVLIYAEVVTFVAGSLEAGGLPGSLEVLVVLK